MVNGIRRGVEDALLAQRGQLLCWVPVCLSLGIGIYFALPVEPGRAAYLAAVAAAALLLLIGWRLPDPTAPLAAGLALVLVGAVLAGARAQALAAPVLHWRYYGAVEGRVVAMNRSQSDALRLTLDQLRLDRIAPEQTPKRVRISLHGKAAGIPPQPGMRVMTTAHLSPPAGPVEPGGFDFQRHAWFAGLGAVGYTRLPLLGVETPAPRAAQLRLFRLRMAIAGHMRAQLPGEVGGFAAALTTGDRSGIGRPTLQALRASNLAHLLAISGLHMGLLTAVVFAALRLALAALPYPAQHWPTRKIAASGALIAAAVYLALSGGNVATERAFIMVATALGALFFGRRAISLRTVAIAATLVLVRRPEALTGPGFQMSFAATLALVAVFAWLRDAPLPALPRWGRRVLGVVLSSAVAGLATAPIAAAHFNTIAHFGLLANLLCVPLMGVLVIPAALAAAVLAPFGLSGLGLTVMGWGLRWILFVAHQVAGLEGARGFVPSPGGAVLPLLAFGFVLLVLWQGRLRLLGPVLMALALLLWQGVQRPSILIAEDGKLVGVMGPEGRALSRAKGAGFVARVWLENDGDGRSQQAAAARWQQGAVIHLSGKRALKAFDGCVPGQILVSAVALEDTPRPDCLVFDPVKLRSTGALALRPAQDGQGSAQGWQITTARAQSGARLWTRWPGAR